MQSGLRPVKILESSSDSHTRADHVVGIDESGNTTDGPFVVTGVQCPRSAGEKLAELLIELGLDPWKSKSSSRPNNVDGSELTQRVRELIQKIKDEPITWHATACWGSCPADQRAMAACIIATKSLVTTHRDYEGNAVIIHDGAGSEFGKGHITLRRAAREQFQGFGDRETPVYVSTLESGDRTYPEITAADYIAGFVRYEIEQSGHIGGVEEPRVERMDKSWSTPADLSPEPKYDIRARDQYQRPKRKDRAAAWIEGRRPPTDARWDSPSFDSIVNRLESETVREYLLHEL